MNILVTGSAGFIGAYVRDALHRDGHTVTGFDGERDVRDARAITKAIEDDRVEAVINLAGVLGTAETFGDGERHAADVNIVGAVTIFDAAAAAAPTVTSAKRSPGPQATACRGGVMFTSSGLVYYAGLFQAVMIAVGAYLGQPGAAGRSLSPSPALWCPQPSPTSPRTR